MHVENGRPTGTSAQLTECFVHNPNYKFRRSDALRKLRSAKRREETPVLLSV